MNEVLTCSLDTLLTRLHVKKRSQAQVAKQSVFYSQVTLEQPVNMRFDYRVYRLSRTLSGLGGPKNFIY